MIPNSISTNNNLEVAPVKVDLKISLDQETMLFLAFLALVGAVYGYKKVKGG